MIFRGVDAAASLKQPEVSPRRGGNGVFRGIDAAASLKRPIPGAGGVDLNVFSAASVLRPH